MNLHKNCEGYADPTAYPTLKEEQEQENRVSKLVKILRDVAGYAGFEVVGRIALRDRRTGREWR
jgi:hypothetical protein